ncbi:MAG: hypothetical protein IJA75_01400 [Oscillospiraceae bacterium]|nr:hypothetical protein [Oscillospiraceae bacterium]
MAHIRDRKQCLTGVQQSSPWTAKADIQCDFVMVYGTDAGMPDRVRKYREKGYVVHLMTGSAWGEYQDYLNGEWDGTDHWDESQIDRFGKPIVHGVDVPYLCPSLSFCRYLTEKIKVAVDVGVEAVHLEEPEFWDDGGYSPAFRREYREFYGEEWQLPHTSCENRYKASFLKVYLYRRLVEYVSRGLKEYAATKYGRDLKFYVPTHSLVNYTQWKILSPEGTLLDIPTVDGCIAQVWTGTSRVGNVYRGHYAERTFETAFLEYGIMQELVRGTGRRMWFLHDPVEDNPEHTWEGFRKNYLKTVIASLLHPEVHHYEVSPWPYRVFHGIYPKKLIITGGMTGGEQMEHAKPIPSSYAELLCALTQTLGDMEQKDAYFLDNTPRIGIFMADSGLYQRTFPDNVSHSPEGVSGVNEKLLSLQRRERAGEDVSEESAVFMAQIAEDEGLYHDYVASGPFPHFFGMAMPLVKGGIPLRPVQLENLDRQEQYLKDYDTLILSYEYIKPRKPEYHDILAQWVQSGGTLIYVGDGTDPYHCAKDWWNDGGCSFADPSEHLFSCLGAKREAGVQRIGKGTLVYYPVSPGRITLTGNAAEDWQTFVRETAAPDYSWRSWFHMQRGPYRIACNMEEGMCSQPLTIPGTFVDLLENDFPIVKQKILLPGENTLLFDLDKIRKESVRIIGTSARIFSLEETETGYSIACKAAAEITVHMRIKLGKTVMSASARDEEGTQVPVSCCWDEDTDTVLLTFPSTNSMTYVLLN